MKIRKKPNRIPIRPNHEPRTVERKLFPANADCGQYRIRSPLVYLSQQQQQLTTILCACVCVWRGFPCVTPFSFVHSKTSERSEKPAEKKTESENWKIESKLPIWLLVVAMVIEVWECCSCYCCYCWQLFFIFFSLAPHFVPFGSFFQALSVFGLVSVALIFIPILYVVRVYARLLFAICECECVGVYARWVIYIVQYAHTAVVNLCAVSRCIVSCLCVHVCHCALLGMSHPRALTRLLRSNMHFNIGNWNCALWCECAYTRETRKNK